MQFSLKSVIVTRIVLLRQLPLQVIFALLCAWFLGNKASEMLAASNMPSDDSSIPYIFFGAMAFFIFPFVAYFRLKLKYAETEYRFFEDRLEITNNFENKLGIKINKKVFKYKAIKEVSLHQGVLQKTWHIGTIYLGTAATVSSSYNKIFGALGSSNIASSGVYMRDINNAEQAYEKIKALVNPPNM